MKANNRQRLTAQTALAVFAVFAMIAGLSLPSAGAVGEGQFDLAQLMQLLATAPEGEVAFTEKKYSSLLVEPLVSSGTLAYRRPDTVEKITLTPRAERFRIAGQDLILTRDGNERRIPLASQPLLDAFAASLRGVLAGDISLLRAHYRLTLDGLAPGWQLAMIPNEEEMRRHVERIVVTGQAGRIGQIEIVESSGDRSVMKVR